MTYLNRIKAKITKIKEYYGEILIYSAKSAEEILKERSNLHSLERLFQLMVDEAVDINTALCLELKSKAPENYKSTFIELEDTKIFERELLQKISYSAGIRNRLVHEYERITDEEAVDAIKKFIPLYDEYIKVLIGKYI